MEIFRGSSSLYAQISTLVWETEVPFAALGFGPALEKIALGLVMNHLNKLLSTGIQPDLFIEWLTITFFAGNYLLCSLAGLLNS